MAASAEERAMSNNKSRSRFVSRDITLEVAISLGS